MSDLVFYTNPMSRGRIIRWMLEEVGQPYDTVLIDFGATDPAYLAVNPMGKVPSIKHGDTVVTECGAICAYLADAFPQAGLAPAPGSKARGAYYRWLFFAAGPIEQAAAFKALDVAVPAEREGMVGFGNHKKTLDAIEAAVKDVAYVADGKFSAADLYLGAHLSWGMNFGTLERRPAFETYVARLLDRPAAKRAAEIDDGLIAAAQAKQPEPAE